MADKKESKKPHVTIGVIGHIDHGKTDLMRAIKDALYTQQKATACSNKNKKWFDTEPEEPQRG